jgi:hypothetical protein
MLLPQTMISNLNQNTPQPTFKYAASTKSDTKSKPRGSSTDITIFPNWPGPCPGMVAQVMLRRFEADGSSSMTQ